MTAATPSPHTAQRKDWWWVFDPRASLRARAALLVGVAFAAFTLLVSAIATSLYQRALSRHLGSTFETLAFQVSDKLDRAIYERFRTLLTTANLPAIRDAGNSASERRRILEVLQENSPEFAWIGLTDATGRVVAATNRRLENTPADNRGWFLAAREGPFIGPLREIADLSREAPSDGDTPPRFLELSLPVTGPDGQFAGVLAANIRWNWSRDVQLSVVPESANRDLIGVTVYGASRDVLLDSGASGWTQPPDAPDFGEGRRFRGTLIESTAGGTTYVTGFARSRGFREYRGLSWLSVVRQPTTRAFASVAPLRRSIIGWGAGLTVGATILAWILAGRHAWRLRSVRAAAERIREGDILAVLPRPKGPSETAAMCGALGDLVESLRDRQEKLLAENARLSTQLRQNEPAKSGDGAATQLPAR